MLCTGWKNAPWRKAAEQNARPFFTSGSASNSISGICGGPLWRIAMPFWLASDASPSRSRRPMARIWPGTSVSRAIRSVVRAAAIATVPHQNEPVTNTFVAASRNLSLPVTAASA